MVQSSRLKKLAREHMAEHPEVKYQQALAAVTAADAASPPPPGGHEAATGGEGPRIPSFLEALGITDVATHDFEAAWARNAATGSLRAPIGYLRDGDEILPELDYFDLLEEHLGGNGPHGGIAGRTGSGKSYFLRSIILALVSLHGPEDIALLLADFKGAATFRGLERLPHTVAALSNLERSTDLIERFGLVLDGEVTRREEFITGKGCADIHAYRRKRREHPNDPNWPALPHLVVVVDEFGEYLRERSSFRNLLLRAARIGRSLGVHLVMSSQYLDLTNAGDLLAHLNFRYCLAVSSAAHSRAMIGTDDAATMVTKKGGLKGKTFRRFTTDSAPVEVVAFHHEAPLPSSGQNEAGDAQMTMADALIERLAALEASPVPAMWTDPLDIPRTFADEPALEEETKGLKIRIGVLDAPQHHVNLPWILDFTGQRPHYAIAGGPKSGRSTVLRTMVLASAFTHAGGRVAFMLLDGADSSLSAVAAAPNVAARVAAGDATGIGAVLDEVDRLIEMRTAAMANRGTHVVDQYLTRKDSDSDDPYGYVVVAIDGIGTFLGDDDRRGQAERLTSIIERGHRVGVHLVYTAGSAASGSSGDVPHYLIELPGGVQLWSNEYSGSRMPAEIRLTLNSRIPEGQPGRSFDPVTMLQARVLLPLARRVEPDLVSQGVDVYSVHDHTEEIKGLTSRLAETNAADKIPVINPDSITASARAKQKREIAAVRAEIDAIIGQDAVKKELHALLGAAEVEMELRRRGLPTRQSTLRNVVLTGAPGTGKSHLAGVIARILHVTGMLGTEQVTITHRAHLIGNFHGDSTTRAREVFREARHGVLFIDDAYDLVSDQVGQPDLAGHEVMNELLDQMDRNRDDLSVVIAGYETRMGQFLEANPVFASQFGTRAALGTYNAEQLWHHLLDLAERDGRNIHPDAERPFLAAARSLEAVSHGHRLIDTAGNLRFVRNVYEVALNIGAQRLSRSEDLSSLSDEEMLMVTGGDIFVAARRVVGGFGVDLPDTA